MQNLKDLYLAEFTYGAKMYLKQEFTQEVYCSTLLMENVKINLNMDQT